MTPNRKLVKMSSLCYIRQFSKRVGFKLLLNKGFHFKLQSLNRDSKNRTGVLANLLSDKA